MMQSIKRGSNLKKKSKQAIIQNLFKTTGDKNKSTVDLPSKNDKPQYRMCSKNLITANKAKKLDKSYQKLQLS